MSVRSDDDDNKIVFQSKADHTRVGCTDNLFVPVTLTYRLWTWPEDSQDVRAMLVHIPEVNFLGRGFQNITDRHTTHRQTRL